MGRGSDACLDGSLQSVLRQRVSQLIHKKPLEKATERPPSRSSAESGAKADAIAEVTKRGGCEGQAGLHTQRRKSMRRQSFINPDAMSRDEEAELDAIMSDAAGAPPCGVKELRDCLQQIPEFKGLRDCLQQLKQFQFPGAVQRVLHALEAQMCKFAGLAASASRSLKSLEDLAELLSSQSAATVNDLSSCSQAVQYLQLCLKDHFQEFESTDSNSTPFQVKTKHCLQKLGAFSVSLIALTEDVNMRIESRQKQEENFGLGVHLGTTHHRHSNGAGAAPAEVLAALKKRATLATTRARFQEAQSNEENPIKAYSRSSIKAERRGSIHEKLCREGRRKSLAMSYTQQGEVYRGWATAGCQHEEGSSAAHCQDTPTLIKNPDSVRLVDLDSSNGKKAGMQSQEKQVSDQALGGNSVLSARPRGSLTSSARPRGSLTSSSHSPCIADKERANLEHSLPWKRPSHMTAVPPSSQDEEEGASLGQHTPEVEQLMQTTQDIVERDSGYTLQVAEVAGASETNTQSPKTTQESSLQEARHLGGHDELQSPSLQKLGASCQLKQPVAEDCAAKSSPEPAHMDAQHELPRTPQASDKSSSRSSQKFSTAPPRYSIASPRASPRVSKSSLETDSIERELSCPPAAQLLYGASNKRKSLSPRLSKLGATPRRAFNSAQFNVDELRLGSAPTQNLKSGQHESPTPADSLFPVVAVGDHLFPVVAVGDEQPVAPYISDEKLESLPQDALIFSTLAESRSPRTRWRNSVSMKRPSQVIPMPAPHEDVAPSNAHVRSSLFAERPKPEKVTLPDVLGRKKLVDAPKSDETCNLDDGSEYAFFFDRDFDLLV